MVVFTTNFNLGLVEPQMISFSQKMARDILGGDKPNSLRPSIDSTFAFVYESILVQRIPKKSFRQSLVFEVEAI